MDTKEEIAVPRATSTIDIGKQRSSLTNIPRKATEVEVMGKLEEPEEEPFQFNHVGLTSAEAAELLKQHGRNELEEKVIPKWYIFCSQLWQPMPIMIWIAAFVELGIFNFPDMAILFAILFINASISYYEITKAGNAVAALKASLKPVATVKRDGEWTKIEAALVVPGDLVLLASGSAVPADCRLNKGQIDCDQAAMTGESLPVTKYVGDKCFMGSTVVKGEQEGTVELTGSQTFFGKTAALLGDDGEMSNVQKLLIRIITVLVSLSLVLCITIFGYLLGKGQAVHDALSYTVVLIVASIPVAIEIVTTTTLALGSKELSHHGAIVTRLAAIEDMAGMTVLCSDKTGTLTMNKMVIQVETPVYVAGESQYSLLRYAAMAAKWKEPPRDALDTLVLTAADLASLDDIEQEEYVPFDPTTKRTEGTLRRKDGSRFKITKGAPHVIMRLSHDEAVNHAAEKDITALGERGIRSLAVAKAELSSASPDGELAWEFLGLLTFLDPPRPDTKQTIDRAREFGVEVKMITGDHLLIAKETARILGLGLNIKGPEGLPMLQEDTQTKPKNLAADYGAYIQSANGFAQVFPEHKYLIVECLRELGFKTGMTGDGVNDAPALKRADVGVAVAGATDAARAAADIVLTGEGLGTIVEGIIISRCIFVRIKNFLTYRIAATLQLLIFFFIAVLAIHPSHFQPAEGTEGFHDAAWPQFFRMPVLLLMLITLLNDGTLISIGYDHAIPSQIPEKWNLKAVFLESAMLAFVALISSIFLLWCLLDSWRKGSVFHGLGLGGLYYGQVITAIYLKVSVSDFLTLFSARASGNWFWTNRPSNILLGAGSIALTASTIIANVLPDSKLDSIPVIGLGRRAPVELSIYIWIYCLIWWFIQDAAKVWLSGIMLKSNVFGVADNAHDKAVAVAALLNKGTGEKAETKV